uniref:Uncharacterized protein n=1 Tax=Anguilla anguilla TaxID=7936 RepID=A0A0E9TAW7_ANGAN
MSRIWYIYTEVTGTRVQCQELTIYTVCTATEKH